MPKSRKPLKRGPKPERLKIEAAHWHDALRAGVRAPKPNSAVPRDSKK